MYAFYGHVQQGSVGDRVKSGQQIGRLGKSGNSFGPHLHFALLDAPEYFQADSIPFVLDRYTLEGTGAVSEAEVVVTGPAREVRRVHPIVYSVSDFR